MKTEQLYCFLQKVKEGQLKEHGCSIPANMFMGDVHTCDEEDEIFIYCVKNNLVEAEPSDDPWFISPKIFRLTQSGNNKLREVDPRPKWRPLSSFLERHLR
jgi:hypothetical protein